MIRPAAHPLRRAAPGRLLRTPGWLVLVLVAVTLVVASLVAPPLFVGAARSAALAEGLEAAAGTPYGPDSADLRVTWNGVLPPDSEALLDERLAAITAYDEPTLTASGVGQSRTRKAVAEGPDGSLLPSALWYHDGAIAALGGDEDAPGVWLAADVAARLGLEPGDRMRIGLQQTFLSETGRLAKTVLAGTYEPAPGTTLPTQLADQPDADRWFLPIDPDNPTVGSPLAIAGRATFDRLVLAAADVPLYLADMPHDPAITPEQATTAVDQVQALAEDAYDGADPLASALSQGLPMGAELQVASGLPDIAYEATASADSAQDQVRPYAVAGQVLATALLVAGWVLLGRSRRREQLLASGLGLRPLEATGLAALEVLPVCLLAVPAGLGLAWLGVVWAGPPTEAATGPGSDDVLRAALSAAGALVLVAVTAGVVAFGTDRADRLSLLGRGRRAVPWTWVLLAVTAMVTAGVFTLDVADRSSSPLTMVFPVLVAGSVAVLVARLVAWLRGLLPSRGRPGSARWLATRRTGLVVQEVTSLTAVVALALGLFAYALTVHRGIDEGVGDKTAALAGAPTTITVAEDFRGQKMAPTITPPVPGSSIVWRRTVSLPPDFGSQPLMSVEPTSFADVADWGDSGDLDAGRTLLPRLDEKDGRKDPVLRVILAGHTRLHAGDKGLLDFDGEFQIPFLVVGVVPTFPGAEADPGNVAVVASTDRLFRLVLWTVDPRREAATSKDPGAFISAVWSGDSAAGLRADLRDAGIATDGQVTTASEEAISNGLVSSTWAAGYVLALGAVILVLALAGALVLALRLADRDTVSDVLLRRMGWSAGELARTRAWEIAYAVATAVLAAALAVAILVLVPTTIDATAGSPPLSEPRPAWADLVVLAVVLVGTVTLAWLLGTSRARRRDPAEVLRAGA